MSTVNYTFTDFAKKIAYVVTRFCGTSIIKKMVIGVQVVTASQIIRCRWQAISSCPCITDHMWHVCVAVTTLGESDLDAQSSFYQKSM